MIPDLYDHQVAVVDFMSTNSRIIDTSDPGVGKTRSALEAFASRRRKKGGGKMLVVCPKSIMQPAWGDDIESFVPDMRYVIAMAHNRRKAFESDADIYITNHDAARWLSQNSDVLDGFDTLVIDEFTAYKNPQSQRSKAMRKVSTIFDNREIMSGTPNPRTILDLWHPVLLVDDGERLGTSYWKFRASVCDPVQIGPSRDMVQWVDKQGAEDAVGALLEDITIRYAFEDCHDIPANTVRRVYTQLNTKHRKLYDELKDTAILELQDEEISALHAGALATKLLQLASGAVYNQDSEPRVLDTDRYELVIDLVAQRPHSLVAFNWRHQRDQLVSLAKDRKLTYAVIDGSVKYGDRIQAVSDFQAGKLQVLFAHPASAAHGLTLTRGTTTIWASPVYDAEKFEQFNRRIYRAGQTQKTETILIAARDTLEEHVYEKLQGKLDKMASLLEYLKT